MELLKPIKSIIGEDEPYYSLYYRDVPDGFRLTDIVTKSGLEYITPLWNELINFADRYFADFEVNARTVKDFYNNIQLDYDEYIDMLENKLKNLAIVEFTKGQRITRTKTGTNEESNTDSKTRSFSGTSTEDNDDTTEQINLAFASANDSPSHKEVYDGSKSVSDSGTETNSGTNNRTGEMSENETTVIDRFEGENPIDYYERIVEIYPNIKTDFIDIFKNSFILTEVLIW